jgi:branched-chain amino acid transport system substrate-binding protein
MCMFKVSVTTVFGVLALLGQVPAAHAQDTVRIGLATSASGPSAHLGKDAFLGARMAIEELNGKGIRIGGRPVRLELMPEDDAGDPKQASAIAQKFCDAKVSGVVGYQGAGVAMAAGKVLEHCALPLVTMAPLPAGASTTTYRLLPSWEQMAAGLALQAGGVKGLRKVGILVDDKSSGRDAAAFQKAFERTGGKVETTDKVRSEDLISEARSALLARNVDAVFYGGAVQTSRDSACRGLELELLRGSKPGTLICASAGKSASKDWTRRFAKNGASLGAAPLAYDGVKALVEAMARAGTSDPKGYVASLRSVTVDGATGPFSFGKSGAASPPVMLVTRFGPGAEGTPDPDCPKSSDCPVSPSKGPASEDTPATGEGCCGTPKPS